MLSAQWLPHLPSRQCYPWKVLSNPAAAALVQTAYRLLQSSWSLGFLPQRPAYLHPSVTRESTFGRFPLSV